MGALLDVFLCTMWVKSLKRLKESLDPPRSGATNDCEPPCGCWESNSEPPQEQSLFLTREPSLQPLTYFKSNWIKLTM